MGLSEKKEANSSVKNGIFVGVMQEEYHAIALRCIGAKNVVEFESRLITEKKHANKHAVIHHLHIYRLKCKSLYYLIYNISANIRASKKNEGKEKRAIIL